jgi:hypothetical protein
MNVKDFRKKIKPDSIIVIDGKEYKIETLIKFRFDDGSYYIKCYFSNGMVFAEDETENNYVFVEPVETEFGEPFPEKLNFQKKDYNFIYFAHAVAQVVSNDKHFKVGEGERFWDYQANDGSYLSLGINDLTGRKEDYCGKIVHPESVDLV